MFNPEFEVFLILSAEERHIQMQIREIDPLVIGDLSADGDAAENIRLGRALDRQDHPTVVDEDSVPCGDLFREIPIGHGDLFLIPENLAARQGKGRTVREHDFSVSREVSEPNLRPLGIEHHGGGEFHFVPHAPKPFDGLRVFFMSAVREVETGDIHAVFQHLGNDLFLVAGRSQSTYDFGFFHTNLRRGEPLIFVALILSQANGKRKAPP